MESEVRHVAIIPDGNRRWAKERNKHPWIGHKEGAKTLEKILDKALEYKIPYFSFWGGSYDNLTKRRSIEVKVLMRLYSFYLKKLLQDKRIYDNEVKVEVIGRWEEVLPKETQQIIKEVEENTKNFDKHFLTFLVAYNGTDEMESCVKSIAQKYKKTPLSINKDLIKSNLWTKKLPPVDLVIRTGSENDPHMSAGFMMWDTAYSQYHFTETRFPDFDAERFEKVIKNYSERERRMGK